MQISGRLLARNTVLNLIGQSLPLLVAMCAIPMTIRSMGAERFGMLSLSWVVLGYFTVFDIGLGRATTKHVAEALGAGQKEMVPRIVWTAAMAQLFLGSAGSLMMMLATPLFVTKVLKVPVELASEAGAMVHVLAAALPIILLSACFSGVLEAVQRFDLVNYVKIPSNVFVYLVPLAGGLTKQPLMVIVGAIVLVRLSGLIALVILAGRSEPGLWEFRVSRALLRPLLSFGGWLAVSSAVSPLLMYVDRFMVASLVSMSAVAFYTAPYDALTRLLIIPGSLTATLYPSFSSLLGSGDRARAATIVARSVKYLLIAVGPVGIAVVLFAPQLLQLWLGSSYGSSATAMQILAGGVVVNPLAHVPYSYLQSTGRPDIPAKLHLLELPLYVVVSFVLVQQWGIVGAAAASTLRLVADAMLLFAAAWRIGAMRWPTVKSANLPALTAAFTAFCAVAVAISQLLNASPLPLRVASFAIVFGGFIWVTWRVILDTRDRRMLVHASRF